MGKTLGLTWEKLDKSWSGEYRLDDSGPLDFGPEGESGIYADSEFDLRLLNHAPELYRIVSFLLDRMNDSGVLVLESCTRLPDGDQETIWRAVHDVITEIGKES